MQRGSVWTVAGGGAYTGKPRPVVIVQDAMFSDLASITFCPLTSETMEIGVIRPTIAPDAANGLRAPSQIMVDKITTVPKERLGARIGKLSDQDMVRVNRALVLFLGIGG